MFVGGNYTRNGGTFSHNNGIMNFDGISSSLDVNVYETFNIIIFNKTDANTLTLASGDIMYALGTINFTNGLAASGSIQGFANVTVGSGWDGGNSELWFNGSATQSFDLTGAVNSFKGDIIFNKTSGYTVNMASDLTMSGTGQDMYCNSGILNLNGKTVLVHNAGLSTGTVFVLGNFTIAGTGTFNLYNYSQSVSSYFNISGASTFHVYNNFSKFTSTYADFHGGTATLYFDGPFTNTAGNFTSTSGNAYFAGNYTRTGGSFSHNSGTVNFTGANAALDVNISETFNIINFNKTDANTLTLASGDIMYALGAINFMNGLAASGSIQGFANVTVGSGWDGGNSELWFNGAATQSFDLTGAVANFKGDVVINKNAGYTVNMASDFTMSGTGQDMYCNSGILNLNGKTVTVHNPGPNTGTVNVLGNFTIAGTGTFNLYNYSQSASSYFAISGASTFRVYNNFSKFTSTYADFHGGGTSTLYFDGPFSNTAGNFTSTSGNAYFASSYTRTGGSFSHNSGTVHFTGSNATADVNIYETFYNVNFNKNDLATLTITSGDIFYVLGTLNYTNGKAASGSVQAYNNVTVAPGWDGGDASLWFLATAGQFFNLTGATSNFQGDIIINKNAGYEVIMSSDLTMSATGQDMYLSSGQLNLNGKTVTVHNPGLSTGTVNVQGNFTIYGLGTFNMYNYSQTVSSYFAISGASTFRVYNSFTKNTSTYADFNGGTATLYFDGSFSNTAGNFTSTSGNAYFAGSYTRTGGSFGHNNGTVNFTGNSSVADVNIYETFNNINFNKNNANTLTIASGDILYALGIVNFVNGLAVGGSVQTYFNVTVGAGWDGGNSELWFLGSSAQSFDLTGAVTNFKGDVIFNKNAGYAINMASDLTMSGTGQDMYANSGLLNLNGKTVTLHNPGPNTGTLYVQGNFTVYNTGIFNLYNYSQGVSSYFNISGASTFRVYNNFSKFTSTYADFHGGSATLYFDGPFTNTAGNFTSTSGNAYFGGSYTRTGGSFSHNYGTVNFTGNDATVDVNIYETFNNLTINKNHNMTLTITPGDILYVLGVLTFNNGKASGGLIGSYSNVNVESDWDGGNTQLAFYGSTAQSLDLTGATDKFDGNLLFDKTSGYTVTMASNMNLDGTAQQIDLSSGNFNLNGMTVTLYNVANSTGNLNVLGSFNILGNGTLNVYNHNHATNSNFVLANAPTYHIYNNFTQSTHNGASFNGGGATVIIDGNFSKTTGTFAAPSAHLKVGGNWTVTGSYTSNGTITFIGNNGTFTGTHTFATVVMNKNAGQSLTMANGSSMIISSSLTLTNGLINTATNAWVTMQCNSNVSAGTDCESPNSYINGPFIRNLCTTTPTSLFYPTGKGGKYRALWLVPTQTTVANTGYTVEQFEGTPPNYCIPSGLTCMSKIRWWRVTRSNPIPMVDPITLTYCPGDGVTHPSNLRIAKQVGSCWSDMGGVGTAAGKGTITSSVEFTEYGDFTLANDGNCLNELPVKLITFKGNYSEGIEYLTWKTASEINNDHFDVERSLDGKIWSKIGEVKGYGNSNTIKYYNFMDPNISSSFKIIFYRLKQVDYNGVFEYSPVVVEEFKEISGVTGTFNIYPNPASTFLTIENTSFKKTESYLEITDLTGKQWMHDSFINEKTLELNTLAPGLYIVKIQNSEGEIVRREKIIVRR